MRNIYIGIWAPAFFAAILSIIIFCGNYIFKSPEGWYPLFVAFLPMCFVFVSVQIHFLSKRIEKLEEKIN